MEKSRLLVASMAEQCIATILKSNMCNWELPYTLQTKHLLRMCDEVANHATDWPEEKLHRWIGFIQGGLLANNILNLDEVIVMFVVAKESYSPPEADPDLVDHLAPDETYSISIGNQSRPGS